MYQGAVQDLIDELGRLPGVGPKSAQRIAFYILNSPAEEMEKLSAAITTVKAKVSFCEICGNISETPKCSICRDARRDQSQICVVEEPKDVSSIERTGSYNGRYHVLGGSINPMQGIGPERLRIRELVTRLADEEVQEVILAMDPNLEGEATATYLSRMLTPIGITVSRLASGLPVGGDLEYADEITLGRALEGRRVLMTGQRATPVVPAKAPEREEILEEGEIPEEARPDGAERPAPPQDEAADAHPETEQGSSQRPGSPEVDTATTSDVASATPFPQPERRYPTPRRNEKLANPWAD